VVLRPGDANEVVEAYRYISSSTRAAVLACRVNRCRHWDRSKYAPASGVARGALCARPTPAAANPK